VVSFLILTAIALLIGVPITLHLLRRKKRADGMRRAAEAMGFTFSPKGDADLLKGLTSGHLFAQGVSKQITNLVRGVAADLELLIFDYGYTIGDEENLEQPVHTVLLFRSPELDLPAFCVRPKSVLHRIASLFGYQDIAVEGHPVFSKNYLLRGSDEAGVRRLFGDEVLSYYERGSSLFTEGGGQQFVLYRWAKPVDPENLRFFVQEGFEVLALLWRASSRRGQELPDDLRQRFGVRVAGDVRAAPDRHPSGIRKPPE
jgi:hypothetical protein